MYAHKIIIVRNAKIVIVGAHNQVPVLLVMLDNTFRILMVVHAKIVQLIVRVAQLLINVITVIQTLLG